MVYLTQTLSLLLILRDDDANPNPETCPKAKNKPAPYSSINPLSNTTHVPKHKTYPVVPPHVNLTLLPILKVTQTLTVILPLTLNLTQFLSLTLTSCPKTQR